jgi:hypothetical protein
MKSVECEILISHTWLILTDAPTTYQIHFMRDQTDTFIKILHVLTVQTWYKSHNIVLYWSYDNLNLVKNQKIIWFLIKNSQVVTILKFSTDNEQNVCNFNWTSYEKGFLCLH